MKPGNRPLWQWCQFPQNGSILRDEGLREVSSLEGIFFCSTMACMLWLGLSRLLSYVIHPKQERSGTNACKNTFYIRIGY